MLCLVIQLFSIHKEIFRRYWFIQTLYDVKYRGKTSQCKDSSYNFLYSLEVTSLDKKELVHKGSEKKLVPRGKGYCRQLQCVLGPREILCHTFCDVLEGK